MLLRSLAQIAINSFEGISLGQALIGYISRYELFLTMDSSTLVTVMHLLQWSL